MIRQPKVELQERIKNFVCVCVCVWEREREREIYKNEIYDVAWCKCAANKY